MHAQFESIHPFDDGNGRTGRSLIHVFLRRRVAPEYLPPISDLLAKARGRYIDGFTAFRGDGLGGWIERFVSAAGALHRLPAVREHLVRSTRVMARFYGFMILESSAKWTVVPFEHWRAAVG